MYTNEGTRRIYLLAKGIMLFGALAGIAYWFLMYFLTGGGALITLSILVAFPLVCGGSLWAITWIVEGFMTSSSHK